MQDNVSSIDPVAIKQAVDFILESRNEFQILTELSGASYRPIYSFLHRTYVKLFNNNKGRYHITEEEVKRLHKIYPALMNLLIEYKKKRFDLKESLFMITDAVNKAIGVIQGITINDKYYYLLDRNTNCPYLDENIGGFFYMTKFTREADERHHEFMKNNGFSNKIGDYVACSMESVMHDVIIKSNDTKDTRDFMRRALDPALMRRIHGDKTADEHLPYVEAAKNNINEIDFLCEAVFGHYYSRLGSNGYLVHYDK